MIKVTKHISGNTEIATEDQSFGLFDLDGAIEAVESLHQEYEGMIDVSLKCDWRLLDKVFEIAGMSQFEIAKYTSQNTSITI